MKRILPLLAAVILLLPGCGRRDYGLSAQRIQADTEYLCEQIGDRPTGTDKERAGLKGEVRLLFLGSEENGYHGASAYMEGLSQEERQRHLASFNMENSAASPGPGAILTCATLGGVADGTYQEGNFLEPMPNLASQTLSQASQALGGDPLPLFHRGMSDHVVFHEAGLEAANISWRFLDSDGLITVPPEYHLPSDLPESMDFQGGAATGSCILWAVEKLLAE